MDHIPERTPKSAAGLAQMCAYVIQELLGAAPSSIPVEGRIIVEVGVWTGRGTMVFSEYFGKVVAVDPWVVGPEIAGEYDMKQVEGIFDARFAGNKNVMKMKLPSLRAAEEFGEETLDAVYVDAIHAYEGVRSDIAAWAPKVRRGGFLCGHDYEKRFPGVKDAVDEFAVNTMRAIKTFPDSSWAVKF